MPERKLLLRVEHKLMDCFDHGILLFVVIMITGSVLTVIISQLPERLSRNYQYIPVVSLIIGLIFFLLASVPALREGADKDEELWLVGDEVLYLGADKEFREKVKSKKIRDMLEKREKVKNIDKIILFYGGLSAPTIFLARKGGFLYSGLAIGYVGQLRKWCTKEELEQIGIRIWKELRKINSEIRLERKFGRRRWEYYDGEKWIPTKQKII